MAEVERRFAAFPTAFVLDKPDKKAKKVEQLLWGDYAGITGPETNGFLPVRVRNKKTGWIAKDNLQKERLLEVVFVDIGQGDGCLMITPDDKFIVIDAGEGDNMARFLRWRFRDKEPIPFQYAVLSHSDIDHYGGFKALFAKENFSFDTVITNGFMERFGATDDDTLGRPVANGKHQFIEDLVTTLPELRAFLADTAKYVKKGKNGKPSAKQYPSMLKAALDNGKFANFRMVSAADGFLPGYEANKPLSLQILGPVTEPGPSKPKALRWFKDVGKTKNGHSVVLKLTFGKLTMLLGGDLNIPSEELLLKHYTGRATLPEAPQEREAALAAARKVFAVDIAKACHHGSADVSRDFLAALNPLVTVISSGDDEPHSHPRPDALGAMGKNSRGPRPLIFSTELARSAPERIKHPSALRSEIKTLAGLISAAGQSKAKAALEKKMDKLLAQIDRSVAVYGAINVRSDGQRVVIAQKLEQPGPGGKSWDTYELAPDANGQLQFASKHEGKGG